MQVWNLHLYTVIKHRTLPLVICEQILWMPYARVLLIFIFVWTVIVRVFMFASNNFLNCTRCDQPLFSIFSKSIYLFITNYLVPLKDNILMPAFFPILETPLKYAFWYHQQFLLRFFLYLLNCSKMLSIEIIGLWFQCHSHTPMICR